MASSNTLLTPTIIAKEALMMLENNMVMGKLVHRQYKNEFKKVGTSITVRRPNKFSVTESATRSNSNITEYSVAFSVATQAHVSWAFSSVELTMTIEEYSERYIKPAANALANSVDKALCALYNDIYNQVGTPGTTPNSFASLGAAQRRLDDEAIPSDRRCAVVNPNAHWTLADALKGTFAAKPANDIHTRGYLGTVADLDIHKDQNIQTHTGGAFTTSCTPLTNGASSAGDRTLTTDGWNASTAVLAAGDVFTVGNTYAVNPVSGDSTGVLRQFVSLNAETSDSAGNVTIDLYATGHPGLQATGAHKNVDSLPADGEAIAPVGTESTGYPINLVFHPSAFGLVTMPLQMPAGVWGARETFNGLSIRVAKQWSVTDDEEIIRLDILYGVVTLYPEAACRLIG